MICSDHVYSASVLLFIMAMGTKMTFSSGVIYVVHAYGAFTDGVELHCEKQPIALCPGTINIALIYNNSINH